MDEKDAFILLLKHDDAIINILYEFISIQLFVFAMHFAQSYL